MHTIEALKEENTETELIFKTMNFSEIKTTVCMMGKSQAFTCKN